MTTLGAVIGPPVTIDVVFICPKPPPPVVVISMSITAVPALVASLAHVAVPVASAEESAVIAEKVSVRPDTVPQGSEQVRVPRRTCEPIAVSGSVAFVPVYSLIVAAPDPPSRSFLMEVTTLPAAAAERVMIAMVVLL